uniref:Uncharacterized protein n=1 Tax=Zooxanthella nutricula TaxID=1333877 RepID=A0A7S2N9G7_9DINO
MLDWDVDDKVGRFASWAKWIKHDLRIQTIAWLLASVAVLGPDNSWLCWPGLVEVLVPAPEDHERCVSHVVAGWLLASLTTIGWATGCLQLLFTFEQRAMTFAPWSLLVFCNIQKPAVGSVIFFDGCDGRSYVRRVSSVSINGAVQTVGDLPGTPEDRHLYSADGSARWLDDHSVRGIMVAGPFSLQSVFALVAVAMAVAPAATLAYLVTSQPFLASWCFVILRFLITFGTHAVT